jgi:pyruvate formate lyase activating enzyme
VTPLGASAPREQAARPQGESPVYALLENPSMIDFPGSLCGVFFISGCNFTCGFCHNSSLMAPKKVGLTWDRLDEICQRLKKDWVDAVWITGGEPTLAGERHIDLLHFLRRQGFKIKLDSNGSRPEILKECLPLIDYIAMDIKSGPSGYTEIAGFSRTETIEESVKLIMSSGVDHEFRTTVIDPFHDNDQMHEAGKLIQGARRFVLQAFVPQDALPGEEFRKLKRTTPERLWELEKLMAPYADEIVVRGT